MPADDLPLEDVIQLAKRVAADFEGVTVEGVAAMHGEAESVELLLNVLRPGGKGHRSVRARVRRVDRRSFERDLRTRILSALREV